MLMKKLFSMLLIQLLYLKTYGQNVQRISEVVIDESRPYELIVTPGRATMILFPCPILSTAKGTGGDFEIQIKENDSKEVILWLNHSFSEPSGLIARCEKKVFVFDIVPSTTSHQDYVKIVGSISGPINSMSDHKIIKSSEQNESNKTDSNDQVKKRVIKSSTSIVKMNNTVGRKMKDGDL